MAPTPEKHRLNRSEKKLFIWSGLVIALFLALGFGWRAFNADPVVQIPTPTMPNPNAFDFYVKAGQAKVAAPNPAVDPVHDFRTPPASPQELKRRYPTAAKEAWLRKNAKALQLLRQGFRYEYRQPPTRSFTSMLFHRYAPFRELARLLSVECHARAERGDWAGASQSALDILHLGSDVPRGGPLIAALVGSAIQAIGRRELQKIIPHLDAAAARAGATRLEKLIEQHVTATETLQEEKWLGQAGLLETMRENQWRRGVATDFSLRDKVQTWVVSKRTVLNNFNSMMDALIANARRPYTQQQPLPMPGDPLTQMMTSVLPNSRFHAAHSEAGNALLLVALALQAFRLEHGTYPAQLAELVPTYLKRVPIDPFGSGESLSYRRVGQNYVLWSIGPDGVNNSGRPIDNNRPTNVAPNRWESSQRLVQPGSRGDFVAGINR
ncbi:MAG: type II secretion system protein GspG [Armatimonadota bacterium]|nr:type II secretion system protein GspG [Armatimonadota bacterium]